MEDLFTKLGSESVWAGLAAAAVVWFMRTVAQPLTARHIAWMDEMERRDGVKTVHLATIDANIVEMKQRQQEHLDICRSGTNQKLQHKPA